MLIRFENLELDVAAGELRRDGRAMRLQEKPLLALVALLERPGEVVTKEALRARLWPDDSRVDYEQGLGNAILKLREALGDSAREPRFIETIPRRGYRFIGKLVADDTVAKSEPTAHASRRWLTVGVAMGAALVALVAMLAASLPARYPADPLAWESYLRGRYLAERKTPEGLQKSVGYYRQALGREPRFALAWASLAESLHFLGAMGIFSHAEAYRMASDAARRALAVDPALAEAHAVLAETTFRFGPGSDAARPSFQRALALAPQSGTVRHWHANFLAHEGRRGEALVEMQRAQRLEPLSLQINVDLAWMLYDAGRHDEAMTQIGRTLELDAAYPKTHFLLGHIHRKERRLEPAIASFQRAVELAPDTPKFLEALAMTFVDAGKRERAMEVLDRIRALQGKREVPPETLRRVAERIEALG
jgi:DNA-binding winged helix-turn-helix (wHTH) protein/Tfp pilus assembly protein PilF